MSKGYGRTYVEAPVVPDVGATVQGVAPLSRASAKRAPVDTSSTAPTTKKPRSSETPITDGSLIILEEKEDEDDVPLTRCLRRLAPGPVSGSKPAASASASAGVSSLLAAMPPPKPTPSWVRGFGLKKVVAKLASTSSPGHQPGSATAAEASGGLGAGVSRPAGSQDSERIVSVAGFQETAALANPAVVNQAESTPILPATPVTRPPMASVVGALVGQEPPMAKASTSLPAPSPGTGIGHFIYDACLDKVLKELDPTHRLVELVTSWKELSASSTSFGEKLKAELSSKIAELDSVRQGQQISEAALCSQIIEAEKRKENALGALQTTSE